MAYYGGRNYNSYNSKRFHISRRFRNRAIIIAAAIIILALIITLISSVFSCICTGSASTNPTVDTATLGKNKPKKKVEKPKADNLTFKEPDIKDEDSESTGTFDGEYYIWNTKVFESFKGVKSNAKSYAKLINGAKETLGLKTNVYSVIMPTHIEMGLPGRLKNTEDGIKTKSEADYISAAYSNYSKKVKYINCYNQLSEHCNEYIYFDSDHNPTALGGYYVYKAFAEATKKKAITLAECKESTVENYYGWYNNVTDSELAVDTVHYWDLPYNMTNTITNAEGDTETTYSCYNKEAETGSNAFTVFLYGNNPLEVIKSENKKAEGKIAIVHDSTGCPVVPYFTYNYEEVYSVDLRSYEGSLKALCQENDIDNVLIINDTVGSIDTEKFDKLSNILK